MLDRATRPQLTLVSLEARSLRRSRLPSSSFTLLRNSGLSCRSEKSRLPASAPTGGGAAEPMATPGCWVSGWLASSTAAETAHAASGVLDSARAGVGGESGGVSAAGGWAGAACWRARHCAPPLHPHPALLARKRGRSGRDGPSKGVVEEEGLAASSNTRQCTHSASQRRSCDGHTVLPCRAGGRTLAVVLQLMEWAGLPASKLLPRSGARVGTCSTADWTWTEGHSQSQTPASGAYGPPQLA